MAEKKIGGRTFQVKQPLATDALKLQFRVMGILAKSSTDLAKVLGAVQAAQSADGDARAAANANAVTAVLGILGSLSPDEGTAFISDLVSMAEVKGDNGRFEQADLDVEFSSDPSGLYQLVGFVLREVLGPFISGLVGSMGDAKTAKA
ncbi:hypothetical protein D3218_13095 [Aureimonas flava]|uniref:Uncharacterized protein n=1 Tax=Aureimonas flava TaxID=2320271 RepID=A0A3A1WSB3_9HYPH|nr:hypothetical protein [Aureimonas flava]RIY00215.1 hypothetical protein D3218_13095 [Aureimonas flava]